MPVVNCCNCRKPLRLPAGAQSIKCPACHAISRITNPTTQPPSSHPLPRPSSSWPSPAPSSLHAPPPPRTGGGARPMKYSPAPPSAHGHSWPSPAPSPLHAPPPPPTGGGAGPMMYSPAPPPAHGRKRAVICGVSYLNTSDELRGSINDAKWMKYLLVNRFKFPESSIIMLTEAQTDPCKIPTIRNLRRAIVWLVHGCQPGDSLVFHFSGHGSQIPDVDGDEVDGYDETLLPLDYETEGCIVDDELNATLVRPLPCGARLHAIIDACHSGTAMDLPFLCRMDRRGQYKWENHQTGIWKGTSGGEVISISACDDHENCIEDTPDFAEGTTAGTMTFSFIQAIERGAGTTYGSLLNAMRNAIQNAEDELEGDPLTELLMMLLTDGGKVIRQAQEPQLTSNEAFEVYSKPFYL